MNEGEIVVGLDIGTSKIVTIIAKIEEGIVNVLGVSEVGASGIRKGQIVDIEEAVVAMNNSLEGAERMAGYSVSRIVVSIGGAHIECLNSRGVVAISTPQGEIAQSDITRVIEAAKAISLSSSREIIHVLPRNYTVDGQEGIKDPIGMTGVRLEVDTHIITSGSTSVRNLEKALSEVGVDIDGIVFNGYANSLSVLSETEKELGVVLVDIGAGTTSICIYVEGSLSYSSVLAIGARHITNDLAIGLRISLESAEKIKLFLSQSQKTRTLHPEDSLQLAEKPVTVISKEKTDEIDVGLLNLPEELRKVSKKTLIEGIIKPRLNEIFTMVGLEIKKSGYAGQTPAGLVVTGGGARTVGVQEAVKRMLAMPVRVGAPVGMKGIIDEIADTPFATVVGLAMYGARITTSSSFSISVFLSRFSNVVPSGRVFKKIIDVIKSFIP